MSQTYVPLHVHSHYSILTAASKVGDLIAIAKEQEMPALALTDSGVMYGAIEHYRKCQEAGIKPIIGCQVYMMEGDPTDKVTKRKLYHLVLLAKNETGYKNLVKLVSDSHIEGFYYKPRISWDQLAARSEGLIVLTASLSGALSQPIMRGNPEEARERARWLKEHFGEDVYIELQDHGVPEEKKVIPELISIGQALDISFVVTNGSHFSYPENNTAHEILLCMQSGKSFHDPGRMKFFGPEYYLKSREELAGGFDVDADIIQKALDNTFEVANKCNLELEFGKSILPDFPVPEGKTKESYLRELVEQGTEERYGAITSELQERIDYELSIINEMGFPAYFLIVWDFMNYSREHDIPIGPGRGSAAGSLVAYALGITNIDPIEHNLLFERFLNPERISMPDIDIDFCIERRGDVISYVEERYGRERVAQIITFGTLAARAALKAVGRVMDVPFTESDKLAKMIPSAPGTKLKEAIEGDMPLGKLYESDEQVKDLVELALQLEGLNANTGVHAAGVVISKDPLDEVVPLQLSKEGQVVTQYSMDDVASLGLLKMDFLGLRNLTIIHNTIERIQKHRGEALDIDQISLEDETVYDLLSTGETDGIFQLESGGMKALVKELKPSTFEDVNALVALFRPGPLNSGMTEEFVKRKHGKSQIEYVHPDLEPILNATYGTIVYQEQIMQVAQQLAGYSLGQADLLRRAMGKKKAEEMDKQREVFLEGAQQNQLNDRIANTLFDQMSEFAAYCFNRSHSAAYGMIAYQTAYLKAHYPVEYLSALLSSVKNDLDKVQLYILTARKMGIQVLPPDINKSDADFTPDGDSIRFGLASIKNVGTAVVERIMEIRGEKPFESMEDFCIRAELKTINRRTLESLIYVGAFDSLEVTRQQVFNNIETLYGYAARLQEQKETGQVNLFDLLGHNEALDIANPNRLTLSGEADEYDSVTIQRHEKTLLGTYVTSHPLDDVIDVLPLTATKTVSDLSETSDGSEIVLAGLISSMVSKMTKKNKPIKIGQLEDLSGSVEFVVFSDTIDQYSDWLLEGEKVVLGGKLQYRGDDSYSMIVQSVRPLDDVKIYNVRFKQTPRYEDVASIRECLKRVKGEDPVVFHWHDDLSRILVGQQFWVDYDLAQELLTPVLENQFGGLIELSVAS